MDIGISLGKGEWLASQLYLLGSNGIHQRDGFLKELIVELNHIAKTAEIVIESSNHGRRRH